MPYCLITFQNIAPEQIEGVLSQVATERFVGGRAAYLLDDGSYSIEAGENDIRAIYDQERLEVSFFSRVFTKRNLQVLPLSMVLR